MNEWQLARYLIDAKKCVDSLLYINNNIDKVSNLDLFEIIEGKLRHFYLNLCILLGNSFSVKEIREFKKNDDVIKSIYYERDKNYAHKDIDYEKRTFNNRKTLICKLQRELNYCLKVCGGKLPDCISINYMAYDKNLFRFVNQISPILERKINNALYSNNNLIYGKKYRVFSNSEDIKSVLKKDEYVVIIENGLTLKEGLQNRQDACIKINVLHNTNMWCTMPKKNEKIFEDNEKDFIIFLNEVKKEMV